MSEADDATRRPDEDADTEPTAPLHLSRPVERSPFAPPDPEQPAADRLPADQLPADQPSAGPQQAAYPGPPRYAGSWPPPTTQPPPGSWGHAPYPGPPTGSQHPGYVAQHSTRPMAAHPQPMPAYGAHAAPGPRAKVSRWAWPLLTLLALLIGAVGGGFGALAYDHWEHPTREGSVSTGLRGVDTRTSAPLPVHNGSVAAVAKNMLPSTIQVLAEYQGQKDGATGSGFVLDRQGHYVTNNHVVESAAEDDGPIEVVDMDGNSYPATLVGRSKTYDLAVLYVKDHPDLPPAPLGASRALNVGDSVVAFGSPLGLSSTVTAGIVSALDRPVTTGDVTAASYINAVQTDAAINPGNSGGPLVNLRGQVVGVNSAIATTGGAAQGESGNIGVGFAIPIEQVEITVDQILRTGEARYPVIGATVNTGGDGTAGAEITAIESGSPADDGGLEKGDLVTEVDGTRVPNGVALIVAIRAHQPGQQVTFTIRRGGKEREVTLTLGGKVG